jgi:hypothetical protein
MEYEYDRPCAGTIAADPATGESLNSQIVRETAVGLNSNGQLGTTGSTTATPAVTGSNTAGAVTLGTTQGINAAGQLGSSGTTVSATPATAGTTSAGTDASSTSSQTNPAMGSGDIAQPVTLSGGSLLHALLQSSCALFCQKCKNLLRWQDTACFLHSAGASPGRCKCA